MPAQTRRLTALAATLLCCATSVAVAVSTSPTRAAECLAAPKSGAPQGSHWYYHLDRAKGRKCWYLRALNPPAQKATAPQDATETAAKADAVKARASASAKAHFETGTAVSDSPSPPPKPEPASTASPTTQEPVPQAAQDESASPPVAGTAVLPPSGSRQAAIQEPVTAPAASIIWPDPPAAAPVKAQESDLAPRDTPSDAAPSPVAAYPGNDTEGIAQIDARPPAAAKTATASAGTVAEILFVVVLGLIAAGFLYRLVGKISAVRDRRIIMAHSRLDWVRDNRQTQHFAGAQQQRGFVNGRQKFVDDLHLSLVPNPDEYGARRSRQIAVQSYGSRAGNTSLTENEFRGDRWTQLLRDLDQIMQSRKEA